jgi:Putative auto-transporter adhesin, head GIN domain
MRLRVLLVCAALGIAASGCALEGVIRGNGQVVSESRSVGGFHALSLSGTGLLRLRQTGTESLTLEAESNLLPSIETHNDDGRLIMAPAPGTRLEPTVPIVYTLTVKNVDGLTISGAVSTDAIELAGDHLEIILSGSANATATGSVGHQDIKVSGSASYRADELVSQDIAITVSGAGHAVVHAQRSLDAQVSGSGSVEYVGAPLVTKQISGSGSIRQR